jgi:RNA polymerase sigma-70 factor (ECF subfamily)
VVRIPAFEPRRSATVPVVVPERLEDLMLRVAGGDEQAYAVVYTRVSEPVFGIVLRVLRDRSLSEEVAQEVLVHIWQHAARFEESRGSAMAWIMTIAHRRAVDRVRAEVSRNAREDRLAASDSALLGHDVVIESVELRMEHEAVRACLQALTALQRETVALAYYGAHTYREVAEMLGLPLGTVKTRIRDGLISLRDCLGVTAPRPA